MYWAIRAAIGAMGIADVNDAARAARAVGRAYSRIEPARFKRTIETLAVAFPDMSEPDRRDAALRAYEHLFLLGVEMAYTPRLLTPDAWSERVRMHSLESAVRQLVRQRPCVLITGHCGNWELLGYTLSLIGFPMHALYRPLDLKPLDQWVRRTREKRGLTLLDKFGAADRLPELMRQNALVGFIADQNAGDGGLFVPFFNRLASTYKSIGLLAIMHDCPIICGQARRLVRERDHATFGPGSSFQGPPWMGDDFHYHVDAVDVIMPEDWKSQPDPLFYVSARYRRALEEMVRRAPEQNLWLHRYWKSRPRHEHAAKPIPRSLREKIRALPWTTDDDLARLDDWTARDTLALAARPPKPSRVPTPVPASATA